MKNNKPQPKPKPVKNSSIKTAIHKYKNIIIIAVNISLICANFLILSLIPKQAAAIVLTRSEILAQELQNQSAQKLITDLEATKEEQTRIEKSFPDSVTLLEVIKFIESLKEEVTIQNFSFLGEQPIQDKNGYPFLPLTIILEGSLSQTVSAIHKLQQSHYIFSVNQTLIESPEGISQPIRVSISLRLYVKQPFAKN